MGNQVPDLSWIAPWIQRIREYVAVRLADNVLIRMPNECFKLNASGCRLLHFLLNGGSLDDVLAARRNDPESPQQIHDFCTAVMLMLDGKMCENFSSAAIQKVGFELGYIDLPILAELAITDRCNIRCRFCYGACPQTERRQSGGILNRSELSTRHFKKLIKIIRHDAGVPSLSFTGGEPTLRKDLLDLIQYAAQDMGMRVNLITNGTLINDSFARKLKDAGLASAQVSIESPDSEIHDGLTRVKGSHLRSLSGVKALLDADVLTHFHATICTENADSLAQMPSLARSLGIDRFSLNMIIPVGRGAEDVLAVRYRDIPDILNPIIHQSDKQGIRFMWYAPTPYCLFNPVAKQLGNKGCAACEGLLAIDPQGHLIPCSSWKEPVGSLLRESFQSLWFGERARWLRTKSAAPEECAGCEDLPVCHGACPLVFKAFPEDRSELVCRQSEITMEETHGVNIHASGLPAS